MQILVSNHVWNGAVESHRVVQLELEHVQIVQTIRIAVSV